MAPAMSTARKTNPSGTPIAIPSLLLDNPCPPGLPRGKKERKEKVRIAFVEFANVLYTL